MVEKTKIDKAIKLIAQLSIDKSSQVLSKMVKTGASIDMENAYMADITEVTAQIMGEYDEVVATVIDLVGDAPFKFLFMVTLPGSFVFTDLMLRKEIGTTKEFDIYTSSAVQEIGNILASAITNVFSTDFQIALKPSPPIVLHDFAGAVFQEYIREAAEDKNEILIIESKFRVVRVDLKCHMFILPVKNSEKILSFIANAV